MSTKDIYPIYVFLPDMFGPEADTLLTKAKALADAATKAGLSVGVIFDYWMKDPYHGAPPHVNGADGSIYPDKRRRNLGKGYYPYSWRPGWGDAVKAISTVIDTVNPEFIQQGVNSDVINWTTALDPSHLYLGYNDTMGLFNQATDACRWDGTYVVSGFTSRSLPKARQRFGSAMDDETFLSRCTLDLPDDGGNGEPPPPPVGDLEERIVLLENTMIFVLKTFNRIEEAIKAWGS